MRESQVKSERRKAQALRQSSWWKNIVQSCKCYYCNTPLDASSATMDHIVPLAQGGRSSRGNVVAACKDCNTKKHSRNAVEWLLDESFSS